MFRSKKEEPRVEPIELNHFVPLIASLLVGAEWDFKSDVKEFDKISNEIHRILSASYKLPEAKKINELIDQQKGYEHGDLDRQALSAEQARELDELTHTVHIFSLNKILQLLETKLMEKAKNKFPDDGDEKALKNYIKYLNKRGNHEQEHVGRVLASIVTYIYDNQRDVLAKEKHIFLDKVKGVKLNEQIKKRRLDASEKLKTDREADEKLKRGNAESAKKTRKKEVHMEHMEGLHLRSQSGRSLKNPDRVSREFPSPRTALSKMSKSHGDLNAFFGHVKARSASNSSESESESKKEGEKEADKPRNK